MVFPGYATQHVTHVRVLAFRLQRHCVTPNLLIGGAIIALVLLIALVAPMSAPYAPDQVMVGARLAPPSMAHPFGTDSLGRDMFSRFLFGTQIAVGVVVLGLSIACGLGIVLGLLAGYHSGWFDQIISRAMEVWQAFPALLLALVIVARLGPSLENAVIALGVVSAPGFYRLTRNLTLSAKRSAYVEAAQSIGARDTRIIFRHILPNLASSLVVMATLRSGILLLASGGLSFVGLGAQPPSPEWGALLASGRNYLETAPWLAIYPGFFITLTVVGCNLLGDGLRDWLDPKHSTGNGYH